MAENTRNITIKDKAGFQQALTTLTKLHGEIDGKLAAGQSLISTLQNAASKNVVPSASTGQSSTGQAAVAPAYANTLASTGKAMENVAAQVTAAKTSVGNVCTTLQNLYNGVTGIDDDGKAQVQTA